VSLSIAVTRIASTGQTATQCPQDRDLPPDTTAFPFCRERVPDGQTLTQRPHPTHLFTSMTVVTVRSIYASIFLGPAAGLTAGSSMHRGQKYNEQAHPPHPQPDVFSWSQAQFSHMGRPHPRQCVKACRESHISHKTVFSLFSNEFSSVYYEVRPCQ
jgi:hypothetical protein